MTGRTTHSAVAAWLLAAVWGAAAFLKSLDPAAFAEQISRHKITPETWGPTLAFVFIALEALLAVSLVAGFHRRTACAASGALLLFFMAVTAWAWGHGDAEACGCFGRLASRGPLETILEDACFLIAAGAGFAGSPRGSTSGRPWRGFAAFAPLAVILPLIGPWLPLDRLATDLRPGADISDLAADNLTASVGRGAVLLFFLSDPCDDCAEQLPRLNAIAADGGEPTVVGIFAGNRDGAQAWVLDHFPAFEVGDAPENALRRYYRKLPRFALVRDGIVRRVWNHAPTEDELRAGLRAG